MKKLLEEQKRERGFLKRSILGMRSRCDSMVDSEMFADFERDNVKEVMATLADIIHGWDEREVVK